MEIDLRPVGVLKPPVMSRILPLLFRELSMLMSSMLEDSSFLLMFSLFIVMLLLNLRSANWSSRWCPPLLASGSYSYLQPPCNSMYLLSHWMNSKLSWYLHLANFWICLINKQIPRFFWRCRPCRIWTAEPWNSEETHILVWLASWLFASVPFQDKKHQVVGNRLPQIPAARYGPSRGVTYGWSIAVFPCEIRNSLRPWCRVTLS